MGCISCSFFIRGIEVNSLFQLRGYSCVICFVRPPLPFYYNNNRYQHPLIRRLHERTMLPISTICIFVLQICQREHTFGTYRGTIPEPVDHIRGRPEYCLDWTFVYMLSRVGYELDNERQVRIIWFIIITLVAKESSRRHKRGPSISK